MSGCILAMKGAALGVGVVLHACPVMMCYALYLAITNVTSCTKNYLVGVKAIVS